MRRKHGKNIFVKSHINFDEKKINAKFFKIF